MNCYLLIVISLLFIAYSPYTYAFQCLIVSGLKKDDPAFASSPFLEFDEPAPPRDYRLSKTKVANAECKIFESWSSLQTYIRGKVGEVPNLMPNEHKFVAQLAHGKPRGTGICNDERASQFTILDTLEELAQTHPVGSLIQSCYSGDLMSLLLLRDRTPNDPVMKNLCLWTASVFGRPTKAPQPGELDEAIVVSQATSGQNMEDLYRTFPNGLISSAAWNASGITNYLNNSAIESAANVVNTMNGLAKHCTTPNYRLASENCATVPAGKVRSEMAKLSEDIIKKHTIKKIEEEKLNEKQITILKNIPNDSAENMGSAADRRAVLDSMLGITIFREEFNRNFGSNCFDPFLNSPYSPSAALLGFVGGSLNVETFTDPVDLSRRDACRNFKFGNNNVSK